MKQVLPGANIAHSAVLIDVPETSSEHMLRPKPERGDCTPFVPVMSPDALQALIREVAPDEVKALAWIAEFADMLPLPDDVGESFPYVNWWRDYGACALLVVPVTPQVLDTLAAFEAEAEDRESDHDDEIEEDEDRDQDSALDSGGPGHPYGNAYVDDYEPDYRLPNSHLKQLPWGTGKPPQKLPRARPDPLCSSGNELVPERDYRRGGAPGANVLAYKLHHDVPDTDMKAGDDILADAEPGWSGKGIYMLRVEDEPGKWVTVAVGLIDPLTKKGQLRKSLAIGGIRFDLEGGDYRAHRVKSWGHSV